MTDDRINLVVMFGGQSAEHDVSCTTAAHVLRAADPAPVPHHADRHLDRGPMGARRGRRRRTAQSAPTRCPDGSTRRAPTVSPDADARRRRRAPSETTVVLPLLHGPLGEDGTVQGMLELANVPYVGSGVLGSAVAMDKAMAKQVLAAAGIPQARYRAFAEHEITPGLARRARRRPRAPRASSSPPTWDRRSACRRRTTVEELRDAIDHALTYDEMIVVEEAIVGREIEVAVLGNTRPRGVGARRDRPRRGVLQLRGQVRHRRRPAAHPGAARRRSATAEVRRLAIDTFRALRCDGLARVDFFYEMDDAGNGRGFLLQRGQHDARLHADLDVPEAVDPVRADATPS